MHTEILHAHSRHGTETTIRCQRPHEPIMSAAKMIYDAALGEALIRIDTLPEVARFKLLRDKAGSIHSDAGALDLSLQQAELDHKKAIADPKLHGEPLAKKLDDIASRQRSLRGRIEIAKAGELTFADELAKAEQEARSAISGFVVTEMLALASRQHQAATEAVAEFEKAAAVHLDNHAAQKQVLEFVRIRLDVSPRVDAALAAKSPVCAEPFAERTVQS